MTTNIIIINISVVVVRFYWFHKRLRHIGLFPQNLGLTGLVEASKEFLRSRSMGVNSENSGNEENRVIGLFPSFANPTICFPG
jgi:hypothetical protein